MADQNNEPQTNSSSIPTKIEKQSSSGKIGDDLNKLKINVVEIGDTNATITESSSEDEFQDVPSDGIGDFIVNPTKTDLPENSNKQTRLSSDECCINQHTLGDSEKFHDCENDLIDEDSQKDFESTLTKKVLAENLSKALQLKNEANEVFKSQDYTKASEIYTKALHICPVSSPTERSVLYANRAACKMMLSFKKLAIEDCTKSLEHNPSYVKALIRRAKLYEETDKLDECLADYQKILELDPGYTEAKKALIRLPPKIEERNERLKDEMLSKLKGLGNMVLKPFGLSTENFQMQKDPNTGSYSINFKQ